MQRSRFSTAAAMLLALCGTALPTTAEELVLTNRALASPADLPESGIDVAQVDLEAAVREIYGKFTQVAAASGDTFALELAGFATYYEVDFDSVRWFDLFTPPGGPMIETTPHERAGLLPSDSIVSYPSEWVEGDQGLTDALKSYGSITVREGLSLIADQTSELPSGIAAITSFEVKAIFEERSIAYRAALLWRPLTGQEIWWSSLDQFLPGVELAYSEARPVVSKDEVFAFRPAEPSGELPSDCLETFSTHLQPQLNTGTIRTGHDQGFHLASLQMARQCSTTDFCESYCTPSAPVKTCHESVSGVSSQLTCTACSHKKYTTVKASAENGIDGSASDCGYAMGCAIKECPFGLCLFGVTFSFTGKGAGLKVATVSGVLTDMSLEDGGHCPGAEEDPCTAEVSETRTLHLGGSDRRIRLAETGFPLKRREPSSLTWNGEPVRYIMEEWAVLEYGGGHPVGVASSSSDGFGEAKAAELHEELSVAPSRRAMRGRDRHAMLVVGLAEHGRNSRHIEIPEFRVAAGGDLPAHWGSGQVAIRADFDEDHQLDELTILHQTPGTAVSPELASRIEASLSLDDTAGQGHRVIVFAIVEIGRDGLKVLDHASELPGCCCGEGPCL